MSLTFILIINIFSPTIADIHQQKVDYYSSSISYPRDLSWIQMFVTD